MDLFCASAINQIIEKPRSRSDAISILNKLNNREHFVYTAFCICNHDSDSYTMEAVSKSVKTKVSFKNLTDNEIEWYVNTKEPFDKAGGYGIQGVGAFIVKKISGYKIILNKLFSICQLKV